MNPSTVFDAAICVRLVTTFAHFLWQEAAILALVAAAAGLFRRASADARYAVFLAGLFILAACPPATYLVLWQAQGSASPPPASVSLPPAGSGAAVTPLPLPPNAPVAVDRPSGGSASGSTLDWRRYAPQVVLAYVLGAAAMLVRLVLGLRGGQRLRRSSQPLEDATILTALARQARAVGLRFTPAIALCRRVAVPTVVGVLRPMVLLPLAMASQLTPEQVEVLLAHELAHIRRCDHLVNLLQRVIEALLFFHPAVWLISRRIRIEREHCCDDTVLAVGGRRLAYAESLLRVAELGLGPRDANWAAALGVADRPSQLRGRIMRLLCGVDQERIGLTRRGSTTIGIVLAIALAGGMWLRGVAAGNAASSQPGSVSTDSSAAATKPASSGAASRPASVSTTDIGWGKVIERNVNADSAGADCLIDFDTGKLASPDKNPPGGFPAWFKKAGLDAGCTVEAVSPGLWGFDMVVIPASADLWDLDPEEFKTDGKLTTLLHHLRTGTPATPAVLSAAGPLPATYLFKTREGATGILQILAVAREESPPHIKIRYKLLESARSEPKPRTIEVEARFISATVMERAPSARPRARPPSANPAEADAAMRKWLEAEPDIKLGKQQDTDPNLPAADRERLVAILTPVQTEAVLRHVQEDATMALVSTPRLVTFDGREATVRLETKPRLLWPDPHQPGANVAADYNAGASFTVLPRVSEDGDHVSLATKASVSQVDEVETVMRIVEAKTSLSATTSVGQTLLIRMPFVRYEVTGVLPSVDSKDSNAPARILKKRLDEPAGSAGAVYLLVTPRFSVDDVTTDE